MRGLSEPTVCPGRVAGSRHSGTGAPGERGRAGREFLWAASPLVCNRPPRRLARVRRERGSVGVVLPAELPVGSSRGDVGGGQIDRLDVHRDFGQVAIADGGRARSAGRIATTPQRLGRFAQSLAPTLACASTPSATCGSRTARLEGLEGQGRAGGHKLLTPALRHVSHPHPTRSFHRRQSHPGTFAGPGG